MKEIGSDSQQHLPSEEDTESSPQTPESINNPLAKSMTRRNVIKAGVGLIGAALLGGAGVLGTKEYRRNSPEDEQNITPPASPEEKSTPTISPTATPENIPTPEITPTPVSEDIATPTEEPKDTPTPEPEPTKEILYTGKMPYEYDLEITSEDVPVRELKLNPLFNKDGLNAEETLQRAILKAHYLAYTKSNDKHSSEEHLTNLSPEEFEERLLNGEDMSYNIYAHPREAWDENLKAQSMKVDPTKGVNFAIVADSAYLHFHSGKVIVRDIPVVDRVEYAFAVDDEGKLTCIFHTDEAYQNPRTFDKYGLFYFSDFLFGALELMSEATQNSGSPAKVSEKRDPDITAWADAPSDAEVDNNKVIAIEGFGRYTPVFIKPYTN